MFYPQNVIEDVRMSVDIVDVINTYTKLTLKGGSHFGLCPFHNETTPSFSVSSSKQFYHCFGCGASGNVFTFVMQMDRLTFPESVQLIASKSNYLLPTQVNGNDTTYALKKTLYQIHIDATDFYKSKLLSSTECLNYLESRNVTTDMIDTFKVGYAPALYDSLYKHLLAKGYDIDSIVKSGLVIKSKTNSYFDRFQNRLMFPIIDFSDRIIAFGGRVLDFLNKDQLKSQAKYINSPETLIFSKSNNLFGYNIAKKSKSDYLILVEGYMDVITLNQYGFNNAIASLGTSFNKNHAKTIKNIKNITIMFDSDTAGITATTRAIEPLVEADFSVLVCTLVGAKDPDEFLNQKKLGVDALNLQLNSSITYVDFLINLKKSKYDLSVTSEKIKFIKEASIIIANLKDDFEKDIYIKSICKSLDIKVEALQNDVDLISKQINANNSTNITASQSLIKKSNVITSKVSKEDEALKNLITLLINNKILYNPVKDLISPTIVSNDIYKKLLSIIYNSYSCNEPIKEAQLINYFDTIEQQKLVSSIFNTSIEFTNDENIEKIAGDFVKIILSAYLNVKASTTTDILEIKEIVEQKKKIEKLIIKI